MLADRHGGRSAWVVNLCFHGVGSPGRALEPGEDQYWLQTAQFEELLAAVARHPAVRLSFDDSNSSDIELVLPVLLRLGLTATFFVISSRMDQPGSLTSGDVRALVGNGMLVGSHGMHHKAWRSVSDRELEAELAEAAAAVAQAAGQRVAQVACPFGSYDRRVLKAVRRHGFTRIYTVDGGPARKDAWLQSRYSVRACDTPAAIERLVRSPRGSARTAMASTGRSVVKRWR